MPRDQRLYMTFPIDFWTHPKVSRLSDAAFRAFVEANGHSRMRESDGLIEVEDAEFLWKPEVLHELVTSHPTRPLMQRPDDGYFIRDYADHQFTKGDRDELSRKRAEAGAKGGRAKASGKQKPDNPKQSEAGKGAGVGEEVGKDPEGYVPEDALVMSGASHPDAERLCNLLADLIEENGSKRPSVSKRWLDAARFLIEKDGRRPDQIERAVRWCQADEFWRANILSMPKLREKYDQLRLQATRESKSGTPTPTRGQEHLAYIAALEDEQQEIEQ